MSQMTKEDCISLLQRKYEELKAQGRNDYPKRADFSEQEVIAIKSQLGPWPRALETAGIKPVNDALMKKKKQKKIERKRKKTQRKLEAKKTGKTKKTGRILRKRSPEILRDVLFYNTIEKGKGILSS